MGYNEGEIRHRMILHGMMALALQSSTLFLAFKRESTEAETFLYLPQHSMGQNWRPTTDGWDGYQIPQMDG